MKKLILLPLCFIFLVTQAQVLSEKNQSKATRNAELEIKNLPAKGWKSNRTDISFNEMMKEAWKLKFSMYDEKTPFYIYTFGNGTGNSEEEAYKKADSKAKEQLPGLSMLYFTMWNMAAEISDEEKDLISSAIAKAEKQIIKKLESWDLTPFVYLAREKRGKQEVHLRYYYPQIEVRNITRNLIIAELKKTTDWNDDKMKRLLTYER